MTEAYPTWHALLVELNMFAKLHPAAFVFGWIAVALFVMVVTYRRTP